MTPKTKVALVLLVLLPLTLLAWLGLRLAGNEQAVVEHRFRSLIESQLDAVDGVIVDYFGGLERTLLAIDIAFPPDRDAIRIVEQNSPWLRQVFILGKDGASLHPAKLLTPVGQDGQGSTRRDPEPRELLRRYAMARFAGSSPDRDANEAAERAQPSTRLTTQDPKLESPANIYEDGNSAVQRDHGWYVWHWGTEMQFVFWRRDASGRLIGFELEAIGLIAELIGQLPSTGDASPSATASRVRLVDPYGALTYEWGNYSPGEDALALVTLPLSHPLSAWRLQYHAPPLASHGGNIWLVATLGFLALSACIAGLAYYLYREHTREVRDARQRVGFVNQVSHELKTPLTNIRMYAELLESRMPDDDDKAHRHLDVIVGESQRLSRLIANVLSFGRQQEEGSAVRSKSGKVDETVTNTIEAFRPSLEAKQVQIRLDANAGEAVSLDFDLLEQILNNLLSNVEKYGAAGGKLDITTRQEPNRVMVMVQDYGPGVSRRDSERIFEPFYRVSSKLTDGVTGSGIGLGLARDLARLQGGDLRLGTSEAGALFELSLPIMSAEETA